MALKDILIGIGGTFNSKVSNIIDDLTDARYVPSTNSSTGIISPIQSQDIRSDYHDAAERVRQVFGYGNTPSALSLTPNVAVIRIPDGRGGYKIASAPRTERSITDTSESVQGQLNSNRIHIMAKDMLITLDSTEFIDHIFSSKVAKHAIEGTGRTVTDHQQLENTRITLRGYISNATNPRDQIDSSLSTAYSITQLLSDPDETTVLVDDGVDPSEIYGISSNRERDNYRLLQKIRADGIIVTLHTMYGLYSSMVLTSFNLPRFGGTNHNAMTVQMTFEQQSFVNIKTEDSNKLSNTLKGNGKYDAGLRDSNGLQSVTEIPLQRTAEEKAAKAAAANAVFTAEQAIDEVGISGISLFKIVTPPVPPPSVSTSQDLLEATKAAASKDCGKLDKVTKII